MVKIRYSAVALASGAVILLAACGAAAPSPATQVHTEFSKQGAKAHTAIQGRLQVAAARYDCKMLAKGMPYSTVVGLAVPAFNGDRAKAVAITNAAIAAYCPQYTTAEHSTHG